MKKKKSRPPKRGVRQSTPALSFSAPDPSSSPSSSTPAHSSLSPSSPSPSSPAHSRFSSLVARVRAFSDYHIAMVLITLCAGVAIASSPPALQLDEFLTLLLGLLSTTLAQALIDWKTKGAIAFSDQATVSGLIIGAILLPGTAAPLVFLIGAIAMLLKHLVRYRNVPIFNPAALGLLIGTLLLGTHNAWWAGTPLPPLEILLGFSILFISWKLRKLLLQATFIFAWLLLWSLTLLQADQPLALTFFLNITPLFLMAFMLIEHTTSPSKPPWRQVAYGALVAFLGFVLIQSALPVEAMLVALLSGNALKKIIAALMPEKTNPILTGG